MNRQETLQYFDLPLSELTAKADRARRESVGDDMQLCTILNAKSGQCPEDCRFCAQSSRYGTDAEEYPLREVEELLDGARRARDIGSNHFGIVTSGKILRDDEVARIAEAVSVITREIGIEVCASLGCLGRDQLVLLREAGLVRYNHNIETSRRFFPRIVSSHTFDERLETVRMAADTGLSVCCGGIIGMGETREDRVDMAFTLKDLDVDSVPINVLIPIPGTPLGDLERLSASEALRTIAVFRLIMPGTTIKLAAGREEVLPDADGFMAGANGMLVGGYLTQKGRAVEEDQNLVREVTAAWKI